MYDSTTYYSSLIACTIIAITAFDRVRSTDSTVTKNVNETEMFYYEIRPELFNWTNGIIFVFMFTLFFTLRFTWFFHQLSVGIDAKIVYTPSLQNYPDLPPWMHYKFNNKNRNGYLYGTPPVNLLERQIQVHYLNNVIFLYYIIGLLNNTWCKDCKSYTDVQIGIYTN